MCRPAGVGTVDDAVDLCAVEQEPAFDRLRGRCACRRRPIYVERTDVRHDERVGNAQLLQVHGHGSAAAKEVHVRAGRKTRAGHEKTAADGGRKEVEPPRGLERCIAVASQKHGFDPEIFTVQRTSGGVGEFRAAQEQIADDARCGERYFAQCLEPMTASPAEIDVAADVHRTRVQRCIAAAVDERTFERHVAFHARTVQSNDAVHRASRLRAGTQYQPSTNARVAQVNRARAHVCQLALVVVDARETGAGEIDIGLRGETRADECRHRAIDETQRQKIAAADVDGVVELTGPEQQHTDAVAALPPHRTHATRDLCAADAQCAMHG